MKINLNIEDLENANNMIPVGWQELTITQVIEKPSKQGDGINTVVTFEHVSGKCQPRDVYFSSKSIYFNGPEFFLPFLAAANGTKLEALVEKLKASKDIEIDTQALKGKRIMGKVEPDNYNGRPTVKFTAWAAVGTPVAQAAAGPQSV